MRVNEKRPFFDLITYLRNQQEFSERAFGPRTRGVHGVIDHIRKELVEIEEAPDDLKEWVDVITLALDGAWRAGHSPEAIAEQLEATLVRNINRTWPDWRTIPEGKAIEHVKPPTGTAEATAEVK